MQAQPVLSPALLGSETALASVRVIEGVLEPASCRELIEQLHDQRWLTTTAEIPPAANGPHAARRFADPELPCRMLGETEPPPFAVIDDPLLALRLFYRLASSLPETLRLDPVGSAQLVGLKPQFRCQSFAASQGTEVHQDPSRVCAEGMRSHLSVVVFLNDDHGGGGLEFPTLGRCIHPRTGRALVFPHSLQHRDLPIASGRGFTLQAEVFYSERWQPLRGS